VCGEQQRDAQREAARRRLLNRRCSRLAAAGVNARRSLYYDAIKRVLNAVSEQIERMKASGRKRGERGSAVSEQETEGVRVRETLGGVQRDWGKVDRLKALLTGLRTCERIERGVVSTNPFSTFSFSPHRCLSLPYAHARLNVHRCRLQPRTRCQD